MSNWVRRLGYVVGSLVVLIAAFAGFAYSASNKALTKRYNIPATPFTVVNDSTSIAHGHQLATAISKCIVCHGPDLGGFTVIDDPMMGKVSGQNITSGAGGVIGKYSDAELVRLIRHGVKRDDTGVFLMPSDEYQMMTDEDVSAIIAYVRSVPPVDRTITAVALKPVGRALLATGNLPLLAAERVDHARKYDATIVVDSTVAYGQYLANIGGCTGCHGPTLSGGKIPGLPPDAPPAANLTPTGISHYTDAQLETALRTGTRPDGTNLSVWMPWSSTKLMTPVEMTATIKYLRTVTPKAFGGR